MKKNIILWMAASAVVMLAFPWLAATFVKGDAGMAVCFLLFFLLSSGNTEVTTPVEPSEL